MRFFKITGVAALFAATSIASADDINDTLYDGLKGMIASEVASQCVAGSRVTQRDGTFSFAPNGNVRVRMGGFDCQWEFGNHFFCGARACETREYAVEGSDVRLVREYLE